MLKCAPIFLFFISMKLKVFRVTQNETPKIAKMSVSTTKLSHFSTEHAGSDVYKIAICINLGTCVSNYRIVF